MSTGEVSKPAGWNEVGSWREVLLAFLRLGLTSFGGPVAHLGYFRNEFVVRRQWLDDRAYADLVALCQFLPGPASSQVGIAIGLSRAGYCGALAAWTGFTLPSAVAMVLFAYGVSELGDVSEAGWLHGLKVAAVAVVAQAVLGMMRSLAPDRERASFAVAAAVIALAFPTAWGQVGAIVLGGVMGVLLLQPEPRAGHVSLPLKVGRVTGAAILTVFFILLLGLPLLASAVPLQAIKLIDAFYRAGSLVFGGGHVVLPLLQASVVPPGWITNDAFLAGYGAAQAVPGPLFTFAAYLGAMMQVPPNGWAGADHLSPGGIPALVSSGHRRASFLGRSPPAKIRAGRTPRRECRRGWAPARSSLPAGLDCRDHQRRRLRARLRSLSAAVHVAGPPLARRCFLCRRRRCAQLYLMV
jgi:chromate transporter